MSLRLSLLNAYLRAFVRPKLSRVKSPQLARQHMEKSTARLPISMRGINLTSESIPGPAGPIPVEWLSSGRADRRRVLVYLHGGAYIMGSPRTHRMITTALARMTGMRLLVPDFRLAPENPAPCGIEDAVAVYTWLLAQGYDAANIALVGESSGGGQCFATAIALRDKGFPAPACIVAFSPWLDLTMSGDSVKTNAKRERMLPVERAEEVVGFYVGDGDPTAPMISPLFDDGPLPPALIQVSRAEILLDDSIRMVGRIEKSGGDASLEQWENTPHAWQFFGGYLPEAKDALQKATTYLRARLGA